MRRLRAIDLDYVRRRTWWLVPLAFLGVSAAVVYKYILTPMWLGFDASLYASAAAAWIEGGNPWMVQQDGIYYAAPPPSLLPYVPFVWMPAGLVSLVWVIGSAALALMSIRALRLPMWWVTFPPIVDGVLVGNANIAVLASLVLVSGRLAPLSIFLKVYAVLPLLGERRWRATAITAVLIVATAIVLPWGLWLAQLETINSNLEQVSATTSVYGQPLLMLIATVALLSLGLRRAGWLAVPLLWPHTQLHYAAISVPGLTPYLALAWSYPASEGWVAATVALAIYERARQPSTRRGLNRLRGGPT